MKVLNAKNIGMQAEGAVYVGRPSKWGNPFVIGRDGTREEVCEKYRAWILNHAPLMDALHELRGKNLICWCAPLKCHGDILCKMVVPAEREEPTP